jgi:N-acyl homoserine lactone hydrolase
MDAPVRLTILDYGLFQVHEDGRVIGIQGYLITTRAGRQLLVDTGFPACYADDPERAALEDGLGAFGRVVEISRRNLPQAQLALAGVAPEEITDLIITHGDIDHVGSLGEFPNATLVVSEAEVDTGPPRYFGDRRPLVWPLDASYRRIDTDTDLLPGLRILCTPGHSPGHLSLLLRLPVTGSVLLTADAISRPAEVEEGRYGGAWDERRAAESAARLLALASEEGAWIVYGHDPAQWPKLRKAPAYYA